MFLKPTIHQAGLDLYCPLVQTGLPFGPKVFTPPSPGGFVLFLFSASSLRPIETARYLIGSARSHAPVQGTLRVHDVSPPRFVRAQRACTYTPPNPSTPGAGYDCHRPPQRCDCTTCWRSGE